MKPLIALGPESEAGFLTASALARRLDVSTDRVIRAVDHGVIIADTEFVLPAGGRRRLFRFDRLHAIATQLGVRPHAASAL